MKRGAACLGVLFLAACPRPSDFTPMIHVDPRAVGRLPSWWGKADTPPEEPAKPSPARVRVMGQGEALGGPDATGREGDTVLENSEVVFVVARAAHGDVSVDGRGGSLVDAADATARFDELGQVSTSLGAPSVQVLYESTSSGAEAGGGSAWIEVKGHSPDDAALTVTTRYTLHAPDRALLLETQLQNTGEAPSSVASLGDVIQWGSAETVAPGHARGYSGRSSGPYVGGVGQRVSYAVTSEAGSVDGETRGSSTRTEARSRFTLAPHEKASYSRIFLVGERADTSSLVAELAMAAGEPVGAMNVTVTGSAQGEEAPLQLLPDGATEALTLAEPFAGVLPLGRYWILGKSGSAPLGPLDVTAEGTASVTVDRP